MGKREKQELQARLDLLDRKLIEIKGTLSMLMFVVIIMFAFLLGALIKMFFG